MPVSGSPLPTNHVDGDAGHSAAHNATNQRVNDLQTLGNATETAVAGKAAAVHTHVVADVTALQSALDGKQAAGSYATTSALTSGLAGKADDAAAVHLAGAETISGAKTFTAAPTVPTPTAAGHPARKDYVDSAVAGVTSQGAPDATTTTKGVAVLLGGTAGAPTVPYAAVTGKPTLATVATSGAYADLSGRPTIPAAPGDIGAQPAGSYATTSALTSGLAGKADDSAAAHLAGAETISGVKTFAASPVVPTPTTSTQAAPKGYVDTAISGVTSQGAPDATTGTKGVAVLLGGTAAAPTVPYASVTGKPTLAAVATSGAYTDLTARPTIPAAPADIGAQPAAANLTGLAGLGDGNPYRSGGTWGVRSDAALATALGVSSGSGSSIPAGLTYGLAALRAALVTRDVGPRVIVCAGDSITNGTGSSDNAHRFINLFSAKMQAQWPLTSGGTSPAVVDLATAYANRAGLGTGIQIVNAGTPGAPSAAFFNTTQAAALAPVAVVYAIGTNDLYMGTTGAQYKTNLAAAIAAVRAGMTTPCLHILVRNVERQDFIASDLWDAYGVAMSQLAAEATGGDVVYFDLNYVFRATGFPTADPWGLLYGDKIHPSDRGHALLADLLYDQVAEHLALPLGGLATVPAKADSTAPTAPTGLSAAAGNAQIALSWTASSDAVGVVDYQVYYDAANGAEYYVGKSSGATSYVVTGVTNGTAYTLRVRARDAAGNLSAYSTGVTATPTSSGADTTAPSVPAGLTATPGNAQVALSWSASIDNVGVVSYKVRQAGTVVATPTGTTATITGLTNGTAYSFTVSALDAAGNESAQTAAVSATPAASSGGTFPTGVNLAYRWKASDLTGATGAAVASWTDQVAGVALAQAAAGSQPLIAAGPNGKKCVAFDGVDDLLDTAPSQVTGPQPVTIYLVIRNDGIANGGTQQSVLDSSGSVSELYLDGTTRHCWGGGADTTFGNFTTGSWTVWCIEWAAGTVTSYIAGSADGSGSMGGTGGIATNLRIGAHRDTIKWWHGAIAEIVVCTAAHTSTQRSSVHAYVTAEYGIATS